jgi:linoleoyl-CoA desaturase
MPSSRYAEIAPRIKDLCERYALPYNTGPLFKQLGTVQRTILRLALPGGSPRPKPAPRHATNGRPAPSRAAVPDPGPTGRDGSGPEQPTDGVRVSLPPLV